YALSTFISYYLFFLLLLRLPRSTLFPYTTLFRSCNEQSCKHAFVLQGTCLRRCRLARSLRCADINRDIAVAFSSLPFPTVFRHEDRKSTRLNSSHLGISYAVFCLKKKKKKKTHLQ